MRTVFQRAANLLVESGEDTMLMAIETAKRLDWSAWLRGVFGSLISGGAGAVSAGFGSIIFDPNKDFSTGPHGVQHLFDLMIFCFFFSGLISLAKYLQTNPLPDTLTINNPQGNVNVTVKNNVPESK
jgi:hypothetical protein